jgi:NADP-dependent 3-hydroxy acid dehydrogenase YdfG
MVTTNAQAHTGLLSGRVALVTGASGAIGRAIAIALAGLGADLCVVGRDSERLGKTVAMLRTDGVLVASLASDLTNPSAIEELCSLVDREFGGLDTLVHSAGVYVRGPFARSGIGDLDVQYQTNVRVPYQLTQALLPFLVNRNGDIVFVNSTQGVSTRGGVGQYAATQHATKAIADSLRSEVNPDGVRVITLHVGRTATPLQERIFAAEGRCYTPDVLIQPEDLADLVVSAIALPKRTQVATLVIWPTQQI